MQGLFIAKTGVLFPSAGTSWLLLRPALALYQSDGVSKRPKPTSTRPVNLPPSWPSGYSLKGQKEFSPFSNGIYNGVLVQGPAGVQPVSL